MHDSIEEFQQYSVARGGVPMGSRAAQGGGTVPVRTFAKTFEPSPKNCSSLRPKYHTARRQSGSADTLGGVADKVVRGASVPVLLDWPNQQP